LGWWLRVRGLCAIQVARARRFEVERAFPWGDFFAQGCGRSSRFGVSGWSWRGADELWLAACRPNFWCHFRVELATSWDRTTAFEMRYCCVRAALLAELQSPPGSLATSNSSVVRLELGVCKSYGGAEVEGASSRGPFRASSGPFGGRPGACRCVSGAEPRSSQGQVEVGLTRLPERDAPGPCRGAGVLSWAVGRVRSGLGCLPFSGHSLVPELDVPVRSAGAAPVCRRRDCGGISAGVRVGCGGAGAVVCWGLSLFRESF
jgi:hypothetical protein